MGLYSKSIKSLDELKENSTIAIPNDASNAARALKLLEDNGVIKLKDVESPGAKDIAENPKNIKVQELDAAQLPVVLVDVDAAVINTNYALEAGLNPTKDAIIIESKESPYANILACRTADKDSKAIKALTEALNSKEVKEFINEKYSGSYSTSILIHHKGERYKNETKKITRVSIIRSINNIISWMFFKQRAK